ncbi:hypothetical protein TrST_g11726 [Triparma strigata]|uniref:NAD-dependent epimerase/dehydratase domain-containing protein n=1 Tax=Triparma strigata TaxID=1606541 RepID=A0A9W7C773_9STRA|nr:hypothetical protein TrST_g11726 [Triparma strigata]
MAALSILFFAFALLLHGASSLVPKTLIVNGKGGGHVAIGYHLAKELTSKGHDVTILQNDDVDSSKNPFSSYADLTTTKVLNKPFDDTFTYPFKELEFDFVFDNSSKDPSGPVESVLLKANPAKQRYTFIGSAGIYEKPSSLPHNSQLTEAMPVNSAKPAAQFEKALQESSIPHILFRCQYMYGPLCSKHYLDYFTHRIKSSLPVPVPSPGTQIVSLTDVRDVAKQLSKVCDALPPSGSIFNTGTFNDLKHTYIDVANMIGEGLNMKPDIRLYDPNSKTDFPFRASEFFVKSDKSVSELDFDGGIHELKKYIPEIVKSFEQRHPRVDTSKDEAAIKSVV